MLSHKEEALGKAFFWGGREKKLKARAISRVSLFSFDETSQSLLEYTFVITFYVMFSPYVNTVISAFYALHFV